MSQEKNNAPLNSQQNIRRRLLTAAVYTPPAILGTMMIGPRHALGSWGEVKTCNMNPNATGAPVPPVALTISSGSNACCPCVPGATNFNAVKCAKEQCIKSCASNSQACATAGGIGSISCKKFCRNGPPGCVPPAGCQQPCVCKSNAHEGRKDDKDQQGKNHHESSKKSENICR